MANDISKKTVSIYIDSSAAEYALSQLQTKADGFSKKIQDCRDKQQQLTEKIEAAQVAGNSTKKLEQQFNTLDKTIAALNLKLDDNAKEQAKVQTEIDNKLSPSIKEQTRLVTALANQLKNLSASDPQFAAKATEFEKQNALLTKLKDNAYGATTVNSGLAESFGKIFTRVAEYFSAYKIIEEVSQKVQQFFTDSIKKATELDAAQIQLQNTLSNLGKGDEFKTLSEDAEVLISKFQYLAKADVLTVFNKLQTYGKLSEDQMKSLTQVIIDFAAKSGQKLPEATTQILQALEGNSRALKQYGIDMRDGSNVTERFGIIMEQLKPRVAGAAEAFGNTFAGQIAKSDEQVNRLEETIGAKLLPGIAAAKSQVGDFAEAINNAFKSTADFAAEASQSFDEQNEKVQSLQKNILPLANRYDQLSSKAKLNTTEQTEMKSIIQQITEVIPGAVDAEDAYGNAIGINTNRVRDFIGAEVLRLQVVNKKAIEENQKAFQETAKELEEAGKVNDQILKTGSFTVNQSVGSQGGGSVVIRKANEDEIIAAKEKFQTLENAYYGYFYQIQKLRGQDLQDAINKNQKEADDGKVTLEDLQNKIKALNDARSKININDSNAKAFFDANQKEIDSVQKQIDEFNTKKNEKQAKSEATQHDELLKAADDFNKKIRDLQQQSADAGLTQNQKEIADAKHKYNEILIEFQKLVSKLKGTDIKLNISSDQIKNLETNEIKGIQTKQQTQTDTDEYNNQVALTKKSFEEYKQIEEQKFTTGQTDYRTYQANILQIDADGLKQQIQNAKDYSATSKQAAVDLTQFEISELDKQTKATIASYLQREKFETDLVKFQKQTELNHAQTQFDIAQQGSKKQYDAQKNLINQQHTDLVASIFNQQAALVQAANGDQEKIADINASTNQQLADADAQQQHATEEAHQQHIQNLVDQIVGYASQVISIFDSINQARNAKDEAAFNAESNRNNKLKQQYQTLLNGKLITQQEFNVRSAALDTALDKKKQDLEKKEFERNKRIQIAQTIINGAAAVIKAAPNIPLEIATAVETAIQLAIIASAKPATDSSSSFAKGGVAKGATHAQGGIKMVDSISGHVVGEMENNEPYMILSDKTYRNNKRVVDALLHTSLYNGGASIDPDYFSQTYKPIAVTSITKTYQTMKYAAGGVFPGATGTGAAPGASTQVTTDPALLEVLNSNAKMMSALAITVNNLQQRLQKPIEANVSLKKLSDAQDQNDRILADADFKQG